MRFAGLLPLLLLLLLLLLISLLYCADDFEIERKSGVESSSLCSGWHAHILLYIPAHR